MYRILAALLILISFSVKAQRPEVKGGLPAFIKNNTIYPAYSLHNCIQGTVKIGFKVNAKGDVYFTEITNGIGADLDEEALRLIKMSSGKWEVPSTYDTTTLIVVPVNFALDGYYCERKSKADIALAIKSYKDQEEIKVAIMNFYRNKEKGVAKPEDEVKILKLKEEIGVDDEYLDDKIETALKKYKQGDTKGACEDFNFVKYMGSDKANDWLDKYCK
ncbi:TonB family protein [Pedobacter frigiditerrae]|uniref:TonB family protein n=1 Tax=Pedobacter frigiditerrae TaxID=2530452 RepID=A0A4V6N5U2_9SPHI|nr:TonB family protein [Pedobacter frigiditerrae]TCC93976.1 TonB family protein [Pedobacter frigiditerrae]